MSVSEEASLAEVGDTVEISRKAYNLLFERVSILWEVLNLPTAEGRSEEAKDRITEILASLPSPDHLELEAKKQG